MKGYFGKFTKTELISATCGFLLTILGLLVILGWFIKSLSLTKISPDFAPMQFTTALCFFLSGITILGHLAKQKLITRIALSLLLAISTLTVLEYLFGISFGLDNLFVAPSQEQTRTLFAGRMSPPTTGSFLATGIAFLLLNLKSVSSRIKVSVSLIASIVFALALSTVFGYILKFETADQRFELLGMALHTASGFLLASLGVFCISIADENRYKNTFPRWVAAPAAVVVMCIAVIMWQSLLTQEFQNLKHYVQLQSISLKHILDEKLTLQFNALQRMANRLEIVENMTNEDWKEDAALFLRHFESYQTLTQVDSELEIIGIVRRKNDDRFKEPYSFSNLKVLRAKSKRDSQFVYSKFADQNDSTILFFVVPMFDKNGFDGFIEASLDAQNFLDFGYSIEPDIKYSISIFNEETKSDLFGSCCPNIKKELISELKYADSRGTWNLKVWPTEKLINEHDTFLPQVVLFGGMLLSFLTFMLLHFAISSQQQSIELSELNESLEEKVEERTKEVKERDKFNWNWLSKCTDGAWDWNIKEHTVYMTPQFKKLLGYEKDEIEANVDLWRSIVHPDDLQVADTAFQEYTKENKPYVYQIRWKHKSGKYIWTLCRGEAIRDEVGEINRMVGTLTNISKLKLVEENLRISNKELEQFAYVASHDLQEPLRTVTSFVQLLDKRYKGQFDSDADEFVQFIVEGIARMQQLINDLLQFSRVDTRGGKIAPINLNEVLNQALQNLHASISENEVKITHDPLPTIMADSVQMSQVFQNLIGNAIKFRSEKPPEIHIGVQSRNNEWFFSINDNGIGIEEEFSDKIFVIFQRLHTRDEYPGTGIGLSLCKKIIERHRGKIWVESSANNGSTFYFTIPDKLGEQNEYINSKQADRNLVS